MSALTRRSLAPLVAAAALLLTAAPAVQHAAPAAHPVPLAATITDCPAGTNWNNGVCS